MFTSLQRQHLNVTYVQTSFSLKLTKVEFDYGFKLKLCAVLRKGYEFDYGFKLKLCAVLRKG